LHLREGYEKCKVFVSDGQFEEGPTSDDLKGRQNNPLDIHVGDEDIAGDLPDK